MNDKSFNIRLSRGLIALLGGYEYYGNVLNSTQICFPPSTSYKP